MSEYEIELDGFFIKTTVSASGNDVDEWIDDILSMHRYRLHKLVVGLDSEWFQGQRTATLQLCVGHRCLIFQLYHADYFPASLSDFLGDDRFTFVGKEVARDAAKLNQDYGLIVENYVDLAEAAAYRYQNSTFRSMGLKNLASHFLGLNIEKSEWITRSRWDNYTLSSQQVQYACLDAVVSFKLGIYFRASNLSFSN